MQTALFRRLAWALALSMAIHFALLLSPRIRLPETHVPVTLEARLALPPPPPQVKAPLPPKTPAAPKPLAQPRPEPESPTPASEPAPRAPAPVEPAAPAPQAPPEATPSPSPEPRIPDLPRRVELRYALFKGDGGLNVGQLAHVWKRDGQNYTLTGNAEATGLFSLFVSGRHVQESRGQITPQGLKPDAFSAQRGRADKTDAARFDWTVGTLFLTTEGNARNTPLPEGTQDLLSFLYQLAFFPPTAGEVRLRITNGRKLDTYPYRVAGEETLETPLGKLRTLRIEKTRLPGEEGTEIWLGMDYHYLPVKVRQTDKNGERAEQVITELHFE